LKSTYQVENISSKTEVPNVNTKSFQDMLEQWEPEHRDLPLLSTSFEELWEAKEPFLQTLGDSLTASAYESKWIFNHGQFTV
jgi:hypothetical protein